MMKKVVYFIFLMGCTFSCKNEATSQMTVSSTTIEESENSSEMIFNFSLTDYPTVFLKEEGLEEWEDFERLHESMARLSELNLRDVDVDLLALSGRLKNFAKKKFPSSLELLDSVNARIKHLMRTCKIAEIIIWVFRNTVLSRIQLTFFSFQPALCRQRSAC